MSVIDELVTDRTEDDVSYVKELSAKGWADMDKYERHDYLYGQASIDVLWTDGEFVTLKDGEIALYNGASSNKGAYNYRDMNRVESSVVYLLDMLHSLPEKIHQYADSNGVAWDDSLNVPYDPSKYDEIGTKTDWSVEDIPKVVELQRYLSNVEKLRGVLGYETDDLPEKMDHLDYSGANSIERSLYGLYMALDALRKKLEDCADRIAGAWYFSGDLFSGEA